MLKRFLGPLVLLLAVAACTQAPPAIQATVSPADGAVDVAVDSVVSATFNVAINESTLSGAFTLSSEAGEVAGVLSYDAASRTATFTPSADLAYGTEYTAAVAGTLRSTAGGRLPIPVSGSYSWSFTTEAEPDEVDPAVTAVVVSPATAALEVGGSQQFTAAVTAVGGADESVTWSSSDEAVATVDADGLVTAVAEGSATITATSVFNTAVSGAATVTVSEGEPTPAVTGVAVSPAVAGALVGGSQQFTAAVTAVGGADESVTWSSSNEAVATVDADGLATAVSAGSATITATSVFNGAVSGSAVFTVTDLPAVIDVSVTPATADIELGGDVQLTADVVAVGGADESLTWSSSDEAVATVDASGLVSAVAEGSATITATSVFNAAISGSADVTVLAPAVLSVAVSPETVTVEAGDSEQLVADVTAVSGADESVTWASSDEAVATVDADGLVTAVAGGSATITATSVFDAGVSGSATVNVPAVLGLTVDPAVTDLLPGDTGQLTAVVDAIHGADESVTWASSDEAVAIVDADGLVTAVAGGSATITATSVYDGTVSGDATVNVQTVSDVTVDPAAADVAVGGTTTLTAVVTATGGADESVTWVSSDEDVATVDADGVVTGVALGTATITATSVFDGAFSGSADVTVVDAVVADDYLTELGYVEGAALTVDAPVVTGGSAPYAFALTSGALPAGLTLNADGSISGTPSETGTFSGTVTVTDAVEQTDTADFSIVVVEEMVTITTLFADEDSGTVFTPTSLIASGGLAPFTTEVVAFGALPQRVDMVPGLTIDADGVVSGTLTDAGYHRVYLQVTDAIGQTGGTDVTPILVEIHTFLVLTYSGSPYVYPVGCGGNNPGTDCPAGGEAQGTQGAYSAITPFASIEVLGATGDLNFTWTLLTGGGVSNARWAISASRGVIFRSNSGTGNTSAQHNSDRSYLVTVEDENTGEEATFTVFFQVP